MWSDDCLSGKKNQNNILRNTTSQIAIEKIDEMCSQNKIEAASFTATPLNAATPPEE